jgi:hypothetical protein
MSKKKENKNPNLDSLRLPQTLEAFIKKMIIQKKSIFKPKEILWKIK